MRVRTVSRLLGWALLGIGAVVLVGCQHGQGGYVGHDTVVVVDGSGHTGPPDHAPAHGWRRKHGYHPTHRHKQPEPQPYQRVELVFDEGLGVHIVVGYAGVYFHADRYYRLGDTGWEWTGRLGYTWVAAPDHGIPTGLRKLRHGPKARKKPSHADRGTPTERDATDRRDHLERSGPPQGSGAPAKADPMQKAKSHKKARMQKKVQSPTRVEDPSPDHRHEHDERPGDGWN